MCGDMNDPNNDCIEPLIDFSANAFSFNATAAKSNPSGTSADAGQVTVVGNRVDYSIPDLVSVQDMLSQLTQLQVPNITPAQVPQSDTLRLYSNTAPTPCVGRISPLTTVKALNDLAFQVSLDVYGMTSSSGKEASAILYVTPDGTLRTSATIPGNDRDHFTVSGLYIPVGSTVVGVVHGHPPYNGATFPNLSDDDVESFNNLATGHSGSSRSISGDSNLVAYVVELSSDSQGFTIHAYDRDHFSSAANTGCVVVHQN